MAHVGQELALGLIVRIGGLYGSHQPRRNLLTIIFQLLEIAHHSIERPRNFPYLIIELNLYPLAEVTFRDHSQPIREPADRFHYTSRDSPCDGSTDGQG